eukprot:Hpha_TRINITY_DN16291_c0_g1::TRINITY_DN16291_c0_g1_i1::g.14119::m.14119
MCPRKIPSSQPASEPALAGRVTLICDGVLKVPSCNMLTRGKVPSPAPVNAFGDCLVALLLFEYASVLSGPDACDNTEAAGATWIGGETDRSSTDPLSDQTGVITVRCPTSTLRTDFAPADRSENFLEIPPDAARSAARCPELVRSILYFTSPALLFARRGGSKQ